MAQISDLIDIIHNAIIKESPAKENDIILEELKSIDAKIKSGELPNYSVNETAYFRSLIAREYKIIFC